MSNIYLFESTPRSLALGTTIKQCLEKCKEHHRVVLNPTKRTCDIDPIIAIVYSHNNPKGFFNTFAKTALFSTRYKMLGICSNDVSKIIPWKSEATTEQYQFELPPLTIANFETIIQPVSLDPKEICSTIKQLKRIKDFPFYHSHCLEVSFSHLLYSQLFIKMSHGSDMDFANIFLAPIYAGYSISNTKDRETYFNALFKKIEEKNPLDHLFDLEALKKLGGYKSFTFQFLVDLKALPPVIINLSDDKYKPVIRRLMAFCTSCRELAGISATDMSVKEVPRDMKGEPSELLQGGTYTILVVDDHIDYWEPFFKALDTLFGNNIKLNFRYSRDGKTLTEDKKDIYKILPDCDLVMLDVILGKNGLTGCDILNDIRKMLPNLPVVIGSTSHDTRILDNLRQANAFIYKKDLDVNKLKERIIPLLRKGRSRNKQSLPNPFFNNNIIGNNREHVLNFTNWTIKHLDGFHGLDNHYFRYFNNHGGRHMIALMHILEHLLRPFLLSKEDPLGLKNEDTILVLYLAVLTHEFGMFPLGTDNPRIGRNIGGYDHTILIEDYTRPEFTTPKVFATDARLKANNLNQCMDVVRKFHGSRSMMMLGYEDLPLQYEEFHKIWTNIVDNNISDKDDNIKYKVAAIIGYHNRFLSLEGDDFLKLTDKNKVLLQAIENTAIAGLMSEDKLTEVLESIGRSFPEEQKKSLRLICAIFRFADALEIDYSRAIPSYIGYPEDGTPWEINGYIEDLKRYIVHHVDIDCGVVTIYFNINKKSFKDEAGDFYDIIAGYIDNVLKSNSLETTYKEIKSLKEIKKEEVVKLLKRKDESLADDVIDDIVKCINVIKHSVIDNLLQRKYTEKYINDIVKCCSQKITYEEIKSLKETTSDEDVKGLLKEKDKSLSDEVIENIVKCFDYDKHCNDDALDNFLQKIDVTPEYRFKHFSEYTEIKDVRGNLEKDLKFVFRLLLKLYCILQTPSPLVKEKLQSMLCGLVMLELFDEYKAIDDVELTEQIQFGTFAFVENPAVDFKLLEYMRNRYRG